MAYFLTSTTDKKKTTSQLLFMMLVFCFFNCSLLASEFHSDTIPIPESITTIKSKITKVFQKINTDTTSSQENIYKIKSKISSILKKKNNDSIVKRTKKDTVQRNLNSWTFVNKPGILLTQTSFINWTKGGNNSVAGIASFNGDYNYKNGRLLWTNAINLKYGISKESGNEYTTKTNDVIDLKSTCSYKSSLKSKWYYSGEFNLTTQFYKGYKGADRTTLISSFFAPARMRLGVGGLYTDNDHAFKLQLSPLTNQVTFVYNQDLANNGAFGVTPAIIDDNGNITTEGENINSELGALIRIEYQTTIMENINMNIKSSFYSDYINNFGNVDTEIEMNLDMKVNQYIQANINSHLLYDDDSKITEADGTQTGPRVQLKQILGIGVTYLF